MNTPKKSLRQVVEEWSAQREAASDHPETADLAAYLDDLLPLNEEEAIREHLSFCRVCNDELTLLEEPLGFAADLTALAPVAPVRSTSPVFLWRKNLAWLALAAALFIAGLLIGQWPLEEQGSANQLPINLSPGQSTTRGYTQRNVPAFVDRLGFNLSIDLLRDYPAYTLIVTDAEGHQILRDDRLRPLPGGYFNVSLPVALFSSGLYTFQLYGIPESGRLEPLVTYPISLARE